MASWFVFEAIPSGAQNLLLIFLGITFGSTQGGTGDLIHVSYVEDKHHTCYIISPASELFCSKKAVNN